MVYKYQVGWVIGATMDFGIFPLMQQRDANKPSHAIVQEAVQQTRVAEDLGFSTAWYPEHHFSNYSLCPSPLTMAAHCAGATSRIRVGSAVVIAPLYSAPRLVADIAFVDSLSTGRLDVGIGLGYQGFEFERFGVSLADRTEMTSELLDMIELGLREKHFSYVGKHYRQPETAISVRAVQSPLPPIWIVSTDPNFMRRAVQSGYSIFVTGVLGGWKRLKDLRKNIDDVAIAAGKRPADTHVGLLRFGFVGEKRRDVERYVESARYQQRI